MKLTKITLQQIAIPIRRPFVTGFGTITSRPTIIVKAETESGLIGWGESAPLSFPMYKPETIATCMIALRQYIAPLVLHREFHTIEEFVSLYARIKGNLFAKTGLETAVWMLTALQQNTSVSQLLGGTRSAVATGISVGIGSLEQTFTSIHRGLDAGARRVKLKIKPGWDVDLVKQVRIKFSDITLMVDGNSSYTLDQIETFKRLDDYQLLMIEQPLGDDDIIDHSVLQQQISTAICLDESISTAEDARKAHYLKACRIINIKPGRVGGLLESRKIHDYCQANDIGVWCGSMFESGIGTAFNLAIATMPNCVYPADLIDPLSFFTDDVIVERYRSDHGLIPAPTGQGIGFTVDEAKVNHYAVETVVIEK